MNVSLSFLVEAVEEAGNVKSSRICSGKQMDCVGAQGAASCQLWGLGPHPMSCQSIPCSSAGLGLSLCPWEGFSQQECGLRPSLRSHKPIPGDCGFVPVFLSGECSIGCSPDSSRLWFVAEVTLPTGVHSCLGSPSCGLGWGPLTRAQTPHAIKAAGKVCLQAWRCVYP